MLGFALDGARIEEIPICFFESSVAVAIAGLEQIKWIMDDGRDFFSCVRKCHF